jgi:hypothetical protein
MGYEQILALQLPEYPNRSEAELELLRVVIAAFLFGPVDAEIARVTRIDLARVTEIGDKLRESGAWGSDQIYADVDDDSDDAAWTVNIALHFLCAQGLVVRTGEEPEIGYLAT